MTRYTQVITFTLKKTLAHNTMEELVKSFTETNKELLERLKSKDDTIAQQQASMTELINKVTALTSAPGNGGGIPVAAAPVPAPVRSPEDIRKEKSASIYQNLQKSQKVKDFKLSGSENIRDWLKRLDNLIGSLVIAVNITLADINDSEYANMVKSKLDYSAVSV